MDSKTIKISKWNYIWLLELAGELQKKEGRLISFDDALNELKNEKNKNIMEFAGIWDDITDEEADKLKRDLKKGWEKWKIPSL